MQNIFKNNLQKSGRILCLLPIFLFILQARPVEIENASLVVQNVLRTKFSGDFTVESYQVIAEQNQDLIYAFDISPQGFVLVPSDDVFYPVLAYSDESNLILNNVPENVKYILDLYKQEIIEELNTGDHSSKPQNEHWSKYLNSENLTSYRNVNPLIPAMFNQGYGWNNLCPADPDGPGGFALVGCVAVSMAQIIHYWTSPVQPIGDHGYNSAYGYLYVDFDNTTYDYSQMPNNYGTYESQKLLSHCGIAVNMGYGPDGSGAWVIGGNPSAMYAMRNYFLFKNDLFSIYPNQYSSSDYREILQNDLDTNMPIIYRGCSNDGCHAWNLDGYDEELFHCNFGWGGSMNGFFTLNTLGGFSSSQGAVVNIQPETLDAPHIVLNGISIFDFEGDQDWVANPFENVHIFPTIENMIPWSDAQNIDFIISTDEPGIQISSDYFYLNNLNAGDEIFNEQSPFVIEIDDEIELGLKTFNMFVSAEGSNGAVLMEDIQFEIEVSLKQYGFPFYTSSEIKTNPIIADLDNNGSKEVIFGSFDGLVHVVDHQGIEWNDNGFPFNTGNQIWGSPAAADVDNDGFVDIVFTSLSGFVYIFDMTGLKSSYDSGQFITSTPVIGELDGDENLEIVFGTYAPAGQLFAINDDGTNVQGFPISINEKIKGGASLADFNNNNLDDIVFGTDDGNLYLVFDNGSIAENFPFATNDKIQGDPLIVDFNNNISIVFGNNDGVLYSITPQAGEHYSLEFSGQIKHSPTPLAFNNQAVVLVSTTTGSVFGVSPNGNVVEELSFENGSALGGSIILADLNIDNNADLIFGDISGAIHAVDISTMSELEHFPVLNPHQQTSAISLSDLDEDGDLELINGATHELNITDFKNSGEKDFFWHTFKGSYDRRGHYVYQPTSMLLGDINQDDLINISDIVLTVSFILQTTAPSDYQLWAADMNADGEIDVLDLVMLVEFILG